MPMQVEEEVEALARAACDRASTVRHVAQVVFQSVNYRMDDRVWVIPDTVRIHSCQSTAGVAMHDSIHVDHWNHMKHVRLAQPFRSWSRSQKELDQALRHPRTYDLPRMLPRNHCDTKPRLLLAPLPSTISRFTAGVPANVLGDDQQGHGQLPDGSAELRASEVQAGSLVPLHASEKAAEHAVGVGWESRKVNLILRMLNPIREGQRVLIGATTISAAPCSCVPSVWNIGHRLTHESFPSAIPTHGVDMRLQPVLIKRALLAHVYNPEMHSALKILRADAKVKPLRVPRRALRVTIHVELVLELRGALCLLLLTCTA
mmetsp:Transcript_135244/g.238481  ORF Transcript_135244/g.238481 Transcript_135244/m.238481 type:complete len:317 (+) Transcript_135244:108-1058(+)